MVVRGEAQIAWNRWHRAEMTSSHFLSESKITQQCRMVLLAVLGELDAGEADRRRSDDLALLLEVVRSYRPVPAAVRRACEEAACHDGVSEIEWQKRIAAFDSWLAAFKLPVMGESFSSGEFVSPEPASERCSFPSEDVQRTQVSAKAAEDAAPPGNGSGPAIGWVAKLICSEQFERQKQVCGRGLPADDVIAKLLDTLDRRGGKMTSAALALAIDFPMLRLPGLLAKVQRILNVDGYSVLSHDDTSDTVELNQDLLLKQFQLA